MNLTELAADRNILMFLTSDTGHTKTAADINEYLRRKGGGLANVNSTSEASVRRWREQQHDVAPPEDLSGVDDFTRDFADDEPGDETEFSFTDEDRQKLRDSLDQTLAACNTSPQNVVGLRVAQWNAMIKNTDGDAEIHTLYGVKVLVKTKDITPEWPVIQRAPEATPPVRGTPPVGLIGGWKTSVILPDIQAGFFRDAKGNLQPTHDPRAVDVALQILTDVDPHHVLIGGDGVDFPELGKYRLTPVFVQTTQKTIDWVNTFAARLRNITSAPIDWLEGNQEKRMPNYLLDHAAAAFGLKRAGFEDEWPVLSLPFLANFEHWDISYLAGYPAAEYWFNDRIKAMHGDKVNSAGSTVHRYLNSERVSTISFHIHRVEMGSRTRHSRNGPRTIMAASPGCLCRIDGAVPSVKGGTNLEGVPVEHSEDWQQGMAVLHYKEGDEPFVYEPISIFDGWAVYGGQEYRVE